MPYTKPDQAAFTLLVCGETVVQLDTGDLVAVNVRCAVEPNTGNTAATAKARAVLADGGDRFDANGQAITSAYSFTIDGPHLEAMGGAAAFQRAMLLTVLGEPVDTLGWVDTPNPTVLEHASIRSTLAAAAIAGPAADPGALL